jgi:hypothetical protein
MERRDARSLLEDHFRGCDVVLVEGFRDSDLPQIEVVSGEPVVPAGDARLLALVSAAPDPRPVPRFEPGDTAGLATFVVDRVVGRMGGPS